MWRSAFLWFAVLSLAGAATRPRYGGTLRVQVRAGEKLLLRLTAERLGRMASSLQCDGESRRCQVRLKAGISPQTVAAALAASLPGVTVRATSDGLAIDGNLPLDPAGLRVTGAGPFCVVRLEAGRRALLAANEEYWEGRPFLDGIDLEMGRSPREQLLDLELNRADFVEIGPADVRRARHAWISRPRELVALAGRGGAGGEALALSIDRAALHGVLLQRQGVVAGGLLPQWLSGYAFLFPTAPDLARARQLAGVIPGGRAMAVSYDPADPLARPIVERIAVNARDAGITLSATPQNAAADWRLIRIPIPEEPAEALAAVAAAVSLPVPGRPATPELQYAAERDLLEGYRVIPLFHLPDIYGYGDRVRLYGADLDFASVWLEGDKP